MFAAPPIGIGAWNERRPEESLILVARLESIVAPERRFGDTVFGARLLLSLLKGTQLRLKLGDPG